MIAASASTRFTASSRPPSPPPAPPGPGRHVRTARARTGGVFEIGQRRLAARRLHRGSKPATSAWVVAPRPSMRTRSLKRSRCGEVAPTFQPWARADRLLTKATVGASLLVPPTVTTRRAESPQPHCARPPAHALQAQGDGGRWPRLRQPIGKRSRHRHGVPVGARCLASPKNGGDARSRSGAPLPAHPRRLEQVQRGWCLPEGPQIWPAVSRCAPANTRLTASWATTSKARPRPGQRKPASALASAIQHHLQRLATRISTDLGHPARAFGAARSRYDLAGQQVFPSP